MNLMKKKVTNEQLIAMDEVSDKTTKKENSQKVENIKVREKNIIYPFISLFLTVILCILLGYLASTILTDIITKNLLELQF